MGHPGVAHSPRDRLPSRVTLAWWSGQRGSIGNSVYAASAPSNALVRNAGSDASPAAGSAPALASSARPVSDRPTARTFSPAASSRSVIARPV